jgi:hypothetical protein
VVATILNLEGTLSFLHFVCWLHKSTVSLVNMRRSNLKSHKESKVRVRTSHPLTQKAAILGKKRVIIRSDPRTGRLAQTVSMVDDNEIPELEDVFDWDDEDDEDDGGLPEGEDIIDDMAVNTGKSDPEPVVNSGTPAVPSDKNPPVSLCPVFHIYMSLNRT